jgi:DNA modification methylase
VVPATAATSRARATSTGRSGDPGRPDRALHCFAGGCTIPSGPSPRADDTRPPAGLLISNGDGMIAETAPDDRAAYLPIGDVVCGDCIDVLKGLPDACVDSVVTDPPYGLSDHKPADVAACMMAWAQGEQYRPEKRGFMGNDWDSWVPGPEVWREVYRVLKPGGTALVFAGTRTQDLMGIALRLAGFEITDCLQWMYGCLSEDTEILIDGLWEQYHKAVAGSRALCYDVGQQSYSWQPVQEVFVYDYCDTAYRICSDHTDQLVTRGHRCLVEQGGSYVWRTAETLEPEARVPVVEDLRELLAAIPVRQLDTSDAEQVLPGLSACQPAEAASAQAQATTEVPVVRQGVQAEGEGIRKGEVLRVHLLCGEQNGATGGTGACSGDCGNGARGVDGGEPSVLPRQDDRREEPSMERRGDVLPQARELQADQVRPLPAGLPSDGPEGRVRDGAQVACRTGDGPLSLENGGCPPREPRPAGQRPEQPAALLQQPAPQAVRGERFTRADLVRVESVQYEGKVWCVRVPTGAFVVRRNGQVFVTGNSGFPKSLDIGKAIDKRTGAEREVVGRNPHWCEGRTADPGAYAQGGKHAAENITAPATDLAREWDGWGTALKPAHEPILLCRKPCEGSFAANAEAWGVAGLNIDGTRVGTGGEDVSRLNGDAATWGTYGNGPSGQYGVPPDKQGRYPANLILSHSPGCVCVGEERVAGGNGVRGSDAGNSMYGGGNGLQRKDTGQEVGYADADGLETVAKWLCVEGCPVKLLGEQSGEGRSNHRSPTGQHVYGHPEGGSSVAMRTSATMDTTKRGHADRVTAARFFTQLPGEPGYLYCAKASRSERERGLEGMEAHDHYSEDTQTPQRDIRQQTRIRNPHPTVKPLALMRWLCRLTKTPTGGIVLDPFAGSGTTGVAAILEGREFILIEQDDGYCEIARARIAAARASKQPTLMD